MRVQYACCSTPELDWLPPHCTYNTATHRTQLNISMLMQGQGTNLLGQWAPSVLVVHHLSYTGSCPKCTCNTWRKDNKSRLSPSPVSPLYRQCSCHNHMQTRHLFASNMILGYAAQIFIVHIMQRQAACVLSILGQQQNTIPACTCVRPLHGNKQEFAVCDETVLLICCNALRGQH